MRAAVYRSVRALAGVPQRGPRPVQWPAEIADARARQHARRHGGL